MFVITKQYPVIYLRCVPLFWYDNVYWIFIQKLQYVGQISECEGIIN